MSSTDRIEKEILIHAPRSRVWRALTDANEFGAWFGVKLDSGFSPGKTVKGTIFEPPGYEHLPFEITIEKIEPESLFSYRWHPYAIDLQVDYSKEPMTLVEFRLFEESHGTLLRITESGFDGLPGHRRATVYRMNDSGWATQIENIRRYALA